MFWKKSFSFIAVSAFVIMALTGTAYAVNTHATFVKGNSVYEPDRQNQVFIQSNRLDFSGLTTYAGGGVSTADVVQLLDVQAGTYVLSVGVNIITVTGAGATLEGTPVSVIGDGTDPNGWLTSVNVTAQSTASGVSTSAEEGASGVYHTLYGGHYYSSADTIDMTIGTFGANHDTWKGDPVAGCTNLVIDVWAVCIKPSTQTRYGTLR